MGSTSGRRSRLEGLESSGTGWTRGEPRQSDDRAGCGAESGDGRGRGSGGNGGRMSVEEQIERSKSHWSLLSDQSGPMPQGGEVAPVRKFEAFERLQLHPRLGGFFRSCGRLLRMKECAEVSNVEVFKSLQLHPTWGDFFRTFDGDGLKGRFYSGKLVMGEKFAEGGQAELYHAHITGWDPKDNEDHLKRGIEWVVKVFKKGTFLRDLQSQLPTGLLHYRAQEEENWKSPTPKEFPRFHCDVLYGTLLKDGRFAFVMEKEHFDLRSLIEREMELRSGSECGPFSKEDAELIMYEVAVGVDWLHSHGIVHRDLKASNVLVDESKSGEWPKWDCYVADYECSVGVVGTGFFRAPEILQACKERQLSQRPEVFSKAADAYSFGMTCYEVLTGKLPFADHRGNDYDLVLSGQRPELPENVEKWMCELVRRCWDANPASRPSFREIVDVLVAESAAVREREDQLKSFYGENYRGLHSIASLK